MADIVDQIINEEIELEGRDTVTNDPDDPGGRTQYGIAEHSHPEAWLDGKVTYAEARAIYADEYVKPFEAITFEPLRDQLIDFGVNAGPATATRLLQFLLKVERDGHIGPKTLAALAKDNPTALNNALVSLRISWYQDLVRHTPTLQKFLAGWIRRAKKFILP